MKVELHLHTSRYSACAVSGPYALMRRLIACGYGAVYITEHDCFWSRAEIDDLAERFAPLRIFPGVEVSIGDILSFQHLLILGTSDREYAALAAEGIDSAGALLQKARDEGHLTVLAHPCRWSEGAELLRRGLRPDAIEYRTCNQFGRRAEDARILAEELNIPLVDTGDVHSLDMVNEHWIETDEPLEGPDDIRRIVLAGAYRLGMGK